MFDMVVKAHLGSLTLEMPKIEENGESIYLIDNEMREGGDHLIEMTYRQVNILNIFYIYLNFRPPMKVQHSERNSLQMNNQLISSSKYSISIYIK